MRKRVNGVVAACAMLLSLGLGMAPAVAVNNSREAVSMSPDSGSASGGTTVNFTMPTQSVSFTRVEVGREHAAALAENGVVYAWGNNSVGQLGTGNNRIGIGSEAPVEVLMPHGVKFTDIALEADGTLANGDDDQLYAWGDPLISGRADAVDVSVPTVVPAPPGVKFVQASASDAHALAVGDNGLVYAWGTNTYGELGDGTKADRLVPGLVATADGLKFTQVSAGPGFSTAVAENGEVYAWGRNSHGQVLANSRSDQTSPREVRLYQGGVSQAVSAGARSVNVLTREGDVHSWGWGRELECVYPPEVDDPEAGGPAGGGCKPEDVSLLSFPSGTKVVEIAGGKVRPIALDQNGQVYMWRTGLGEGYYPKDLPGLVALPEGVKAVDVASNDADMALVGDDGKVYLVVNGGVSAVETSRAITPIAVDFGGVAGTGLTNVSGATWCVVSPAGKGVQSVEISFVDAAGVRQRMPGGQFTYNTVKVTPAPSPNTSSSVSPFVDVKKTDKFYREIDWMFQNKLSTGTQTASGVMYRPKLELSREAMAAFMYRLEAPKNFQPPKVSPFTDVPTSHKFFKEIAWMKDSKLSTGYADGSYRPKDSLSREAMAAFIYRVEAKSSKGFSAPKKAVFTDVRVGQKFAKEIAWMKDSMLSTGYADGSYRPKDGLSREAMAAFIYRLSVGYRKR